MITLKTMDCPVEQFAVGSALFRCGQMTPKKRSAFADQPAFTQLQAHLGVAAPLRSVKWEHQLGLLANKVCPRKSRGYGQGNIELLAKELEDSTVTANRLWIARKLAVAVETSELDDLLGMAAKADFDLTISHVFSLVTLKDETQRHPIGKQCIEAGWGVKQLRREIHKLQGKQSGGGVALAEPDSADEALRDLLERSRDWTNRARKIWFGSGASCLSQPMSKSTVSRLMDKLEEADSVLKELGAEVEGARRALRAQQSRASVPGSSNTLRPRVTKKRDK